MANIRDVAELAGTSISTVSKYFNNPSSLTPSYKERIEKAVKELGYTPASSSHNKKAYRKKTIALIVPNITNTFYAEIFNGIFRAAEDKDCIVELFASKHDNDILSMLLDNAVSKNVDGIVLGFLDEDEMADKLNRIQKKVPLVLLSWNMNNDFNSVVVNLPDVIYTVTKHIIELGHKRIAFVNGTPNSRFSDEKFLGFKMAMNEAGLDIRSDYYYEGDYLYRTGYQAANKFMSLPEAPTAIIAANDVIAIGCTRYLEKYHYRIPEDVAVTGMDGVQLSTITTPTLTTMAMPIFPMCFEAIDILTEKISRPWTRNKHTIFNTKLVVGQSTDKDAPLYLDF